MSKIFRILPHLLIVLALVFLAMVILDWYNPYMSFLGLPVSTILMVVFCYLSVVLSARMIVCERKLHAESKDWQEKENASKPEPILLAANHRYREMRF